MEIDRSRVVDWRACPAWKGDGAFQKWKPIENCLIWKVIGSFEKQKVGRCAVTKICKDFLCPGTGPHYLQVMFGGLKKLTLAK